jgi:hypothetical protein
MFIIEAHFAGTRKLLLALRCGEGGKVIGILVIFDVFMVVWGQQGVLLLVEGREFVGEVFGKLHANNRSKRDFISFTLHQHDILEFCPCVSWIAVAVVVVDQIALDDGLGREVDQGKVDACHHETNQSGHDSYYQGIGEGLSEVFDL